MYVAFIKNTSEMSIIVSAIEFATAHHKGMFRKGTNIPYMTHLFNVCKLLAERECVEVVLVAALLHDIVEDTDVTIEEVERRFGNEVSSMVAASTEPYKLDKAEFNEVGTWQERKMHTIEMVKNKLPLNEALVILADKIDNISSIENDLERLGVVVWNRFNAPQQDQKWYYQSLVKSFSLHQYNSKTYNDLLAVFKKKVGGVF